MKKKIGLFLIKGMCILFIVSGIAGFIICSNDGGVSIPSSPHDHSYRETETAEGAERMLYSLGVIGVGVIGLLSARQEK